MSDTRQVITVLRLAERGTLNWLAGAFEFSLHEVTEDGEGGLQHAQMRFGDSWIMASTGGRLEQPTGSASLYLTVAEDAEVDAAYDRAMEAGGTSILPPAPMPYGGRNATIRDPEGNLWSVGTYQPAAE